MAGPRKREAQIRRLIEKGVAVPEIARRLKISQVNARVIIHKYGIEYPLSMRRESRSGRKCRVCGCQPVVCRGACYTCYHRIQMRLINGGGEIASVKSYAWSESEILLAREILEYGIDKHSANR